MSEYRGTKEIAQTIRTELKTNPALKGFKFSTVYESFSGGSSITVSVMKSPIRLIRTIDEISPEAIWIAANHRYTKEGIIETQKSRYHQLNQYQLKDDYKEEAWNNGVFLTKQGHDILKLVNEIVSKEHWDKSDIQSDYFHCNFYYHIHLGKWDEPMQDGE